MHHQGHFWLDELVGIDWKKNIWLKFSQTKALFPVLVAAKHWFRSYVWHERQATYIYIFYIHPLILILIVEFVQAGSEKKQVVCHFPHFCDFSHLTLRYILSEYTDGFSLLLIELLVFVVWITSVSDFLQCCFFPPINSLHSLAPCSFQLLPVACKEASCHYVYRLLSGRTTLSPTLRAHGWHKQKEKRTLSAQHVFTSQ